MLDRAQWRRQALAVALAVGVGGGVPASAQVVSDRGEGIPTSLFGTYVEAGELLVYPFYEYTTTGAYEYKPNELGYSGSADFLGELTQHEYLLFLAWGISERVAIEVEGAIYTQATFDKAANDPSAVPRRFSESGLGDVEGQVRWRWNRETVERPELYSYWELVLPLQKDKHLIGTQDWESAFGFGVIRGYDWGTINSRIALAYDGDGNQIELGEYAVEYLKRTSEQWRWVATLEGESDEVSLIGEAQWHFSPRGFVKLNCGFGLTEKAPDLAPEVGVLFRF